MNRMLAIDYPGFLDTALISLDWGNKGLVIYHGDCRTLNTIR